MYWWSRRSKKENLVYIQQWTTKPKRQTFSFEADKESNEAKFTLFKDGPSVMNLKALEERLNKVESGQIN